MTSGPILRNRLYYSAKPFLPWRLRLALRRWHAQRILRRSGECWPILPSACRPPEGWAGWPEDRRFAVVLTHDVESQQGLDRVRRLAELEQGLGFRSSFNFIPEDCYVVPSALRGWLVEQGFEVGVHDLRHDGRLFASEGAFAAGVPRINRHLADWGAVGFRSGFMLRNLNWLHQLDIAYDASTFDTDPFEPQPGGQGTIFPFWVPNLGSPGGTPESTGSVSGVRSPGFPGPGPRTGYVELPYTLPQDSTLFLVLREASPGIWLRKLDWVAEHGGMVLVNVHPDYLQFDGERASPRTFPVGFYLELLNHIRRRHAGCFWQALPRQVATFVRGVHPAPVRRKPRRICLVTYSSYETDQRVMRYADALAARGDEVDVLALQRAPEVPRQETIRGVRIVRVQRRYGKQQTHQWSYLLPLLRFLLRASLWILRSSARRRYDLFHIHNVPDFLVFAALYPRLLGARVILDIHDIVPEFYASKFKGRGEPSLPGWALWMEAVSARVADHVIIANDLWLEKYARRTRTEGRCSVFINNVDAEIFRPRSRRQDGRRPRLLFPGGLQRHQGVDIALRAFPQVLQAYPNAEFHIYGDGNMKGELTALARELGLNGQVQFHAPLPVRQIAEIMADADLGVVPKRADSFGDEAYSTKILEFMSVGVPVVVSSTRVDRHYFDDSVVRFFESGNPAAMAQAILSVLGNETERQRMVSQASAYAARHSWQTRKADYLRLVDTLLDSR